jgi:hypothetical protein
MKVDQQCSLNEKNKRNQKVIWAKGEGGGTRFRSKDERLSQVCLFIKRRS